MIVLRRLHRRLENPILMADGLARMRTVRAPAVFMIFLILIGGMGLLEYAIQLQGPPAEASVSAVVGASIFQTMAYTQLSLVCVFVPALSAAAISGEREHQTLDMLLVSRMSTSAIVAGKLGIALGHSFLLILAAVPVLASVFLFGGVEFDQLLVTELLTVSTAIALAAMGVFFSAVCRRTLLATILAYGTSGTLLLGTLLVGAILTSLSPAIGRAFTLHPIGLMSPLAALYCLISHPSGMHLPLGAIVRALFLITPGAPGPNEIRLEPWQLSVSFELLLAVIGFVGATFELGRSRVSGRRP